MVEETVVDAGMQFIEGERVDFVKSFIPDIAKMLMGSNIPQLVLIFKPATFAQNSKDPDAERFANDAKNYFESNNISYINFIEDQRLGADCYAKGDHYNIKGRYLITKHVASLLKEML